MKQIALVLFLAFPVLAQISGPTLWLPGNPPAALGQACTVPAYGYYNMATGVAAGCPSGTLVWTAFAVSGSAITGGTCTNQAVTALSVAGVPTCTTITSAYVTNSIAATGVDINTSNQVTATHLAAALPVLQGGTGVTTSTGTGATVLGTSPTFTTNVTLPQITYTGQNVVELVVQGTVLAAALNTLHTTPVSVISAATGTAYFIDGAIFEEIYAGQVYTWSGTFTLFYNNGSGSGAAAGSCSSAFLTTASNRVCVVQPNQLGNVAGAGIVDVPIVIAATADPTGTPGTSTVVYTIFYHAVSGLT